MNTTQLFTVSIGSLAAINALMFNPLTAIAALALAVIIVTNLKMPHSWFLGGCGFLLAELSPISLHASLPIALVYQGLCVLLLVSVLSIRKNRSWTTGSRRVLVRTAALAAIPFVAFTAVAETGAVLATANQLFALGVATLLAVLCVMLAAEHYGDYFVAPAGE